MLRQRGAEQSGGSNAALKGPAWWLRGAEELDETSAVASARSREGETAAVLGDPVEGRWALLRPMEKWRRGIQE